ncbi:hypothetical protein J2X20_004062 [Pelomonas saccharophila]|uniref:Uncharacterized protein n=1 Tax=Roseateles saccharophilus TaxID=304 RepID=A0ABU1YRB6_ROSSA|nr:hypothetical protein [Roseateles saccharophilus]MDR7271394.1 hypothetical protein [Roseateles saccharophilus]
MALRLEPFTAFDGLTFSLTVEDLVARLGPPNHCSRNNVALTAYDYGHSVLRFQDNGRLEEITKRAPVLQLGTVAIPFAALASFVLAQDTEAFERAGFLVSPAFGIAFVPGEPDWVTALARHCIPTWRAL